MSSPLFSARVAPGRDENGWVVTPLTFTHAVYQVLEEFPASRQSEIRGLLKERNQNPHNLKASLRDLHNAGYLKYSQGKGNPDDADDWLRCRWSVTDKLYTPRKPAMKKIKPAVKQVPTPPPSPVHDAEKSPQHLALVQGIATLDANDPNFGEVAKQIAGKMEAPKKSGTEAGARPALVTGIFIEIGTQSLVAQPADLRQLYLELKTLFEG